MKFEISEPCDETWDAMEPRAGGRFCERCETVVIDLAGLSRAQAERRVRAHQGADVCVRLGLDRFGDAVFVAPPKSRAPRFVGGLVLVAALSAGGCNTEPAPSELAGAALDPGPPMMPSPVNVATAPAPSTPTSRATGPVDASELEQPTWANPPTAEQRALTARKLRPARPVRPHHMRLGRMHRP